MPFTETKNINSKKETLLLHHEKIDAYNKKTPAFSETLKKHKAFPLTSNKLENLQVNLGYMCNQTCKHCHVEAGPNRKEIMQKETMQACLNALNTYPFNSIDITGGAPEMNPHFRWFIEEARKTNIKEIIVRCNLTIILANAKYNDLPQFFKENNVRVVSSLPFYNSERTDKQRGNGVFEKSIYALQMLNKVGYGKENSNLILDLVYNPNGAFLSANQKLLEKEFKVELQKKYNITFNTLIALNNMPIKRFLEYLINSDNYKEYMDLLLRSFNPSTISGLMCKNTISVAWNGNLYDCDFNQMLELPLTINGVNIFNFNSEKLYNRNIATEIHCYGCTAGAGSSCKGSLTE